MIITVNDRPRQFFTYYAGVFFFKFILKGKGMLTIFPWIKLHLTYKNIYVYIYIYGILYFKKT